jgi:hypothetical protein
MLSQMGFNRIVYKASRIGGSETKAIKYSKELFKLSPLTGMSTGRIDEYYKRYKAAELQYKKREFCSELSDVG